MLKGVVLVLLIAVACTNCLKFRPRVTLRAGLLPHMLCPFLRTQEIDLHHSPYSTELGTGRFAPFLSSGPLFVFRQWEGWMRRRHKKDLGCLPKYMLNILNRSNMRRQEKKIMGEGRIYILSIFNIFKIWEGGKKEDLGCRPELEDLGSGSAPAFRQPFSDHLRSPHSLPVFNMCSMYALPYGRWQHIPM